MLPEDHAERMGEIREIASEYGLKSIYNMDESGFFGMDLRKSYFSPFEDPHLARGTDWQKQKSRISIPLGVHDLCW